MMMLLMGLVSEAWQFLGLRIVLGAVGGVSAAALAMVTLVAPRERIVKVQPNRRLEARHPEIESVQHPARGACLIAHYSLLDCVFQSLRIAVRADGKSRAREAQ